MVSVTVPMSVSVMISAVIPVSMSIMVFTVILAFMPMPVSECIPVFFISFFPVTADSFQKGQQFLLFLSRETGKHFLMPLSALL